MVQMVPISLGPPPTPLPPDHALHLVATRVCTILSYRYVYIPYQGFLINKVLKIRFNKFNFKLKTMNP